MKRQTLGYSVSERHVEACNISQYIVYFTIYFIYFTSFSAQEPLKNSGVESDWNNILVPRGPRSFCQHQRFLVPAKGIAASRNEIAEKRKTLLVGQSDTHQNLNVPGQPSLKGILCMNYMQHAIVVCAISPGKILAVYMTGGGGGQCSTELHISTNPKNTWAWNFTPPKKGYLASKFSTKNWHTRLNYLNTDLFNQIDFMT